MRTYPLVALFSLLAVMMTSTNLSGSRNNRDDNAAVMVVVEAYSSYADSLPNGRNVPGSSAIGHTNSGGGGARNAFGNAFANAGRSWTTSLCQADSDGDGQTNGFELGDPDCVWSSGQTPSRTTDISHPGLSSSTSAATTAAVTTTTTTTTIPPTTTTTTMAPTTTTTTAAPVVSTSTTTSPETTTTTTAMPPASTTTEASVASTTTTESPTSTTTTAAPAMDSGSSSGSMDDGGSWTAVPSLWADVFEGHWRLVSTEAGHKIEVRMVCSGDRYCSWGFTPSATSGMQGYLVACYANGLSTASCAYYNAGSYSLGTVASPAFGELVSTVQDGSGTATITVRIDAASVGANGGVNLRSIFAFGSWSNNVPSKHTGSNRKGMSIMYDPSTTTTGAPTTMDSTPTTMEPVTTTADVSNRQNQVATLRIQGTQFGTILSDTTKAAALKVAICNDVARLMQTRASLCTVVSWRIGSLIAEISLQPDEQKPADLSLDSVLDDAAKNNASAWLVDTSSQYSQDTSSSETLSLQSYHLGPDTTTTTTESTTTTMQPTTTIPPPTTTTRPPTTTTASVTSTTLAVTSSSTTAAATTTGAESTTTTAEDVADELAPGDIVGIIVGTIACAFFAAAHAMPSKIFGGCVTRATPSFSSSGGDGGRREGALLAQPLLSAPDSTGSASLLNAPPFDQKQRGTPSSSESVLATTASRQVGKMKVRTPTAADDDLLGGPPDGAAARRAREDLL